MYAIESAIQDRHSVYTLSVADASALALRTLSNPSSAFSKCGSRRSASRNDSSASSYLIGPPRQQRSDTVTQ
eukprot:7392764-Pyramimonas_sp.AAC.2